MNVPFFFALSVAMISLGTMLVFSLLTARQSHKPANYILCGLIVLFCYYALVKVLSNTSGILDYPYLIRTYRPLFILGCTGIYWYCKAITTQGFRLTARESLHLIPFGVYTLVMMPFFLADTTTKIESLSWQPFTLIWATERSFWVVVFVFYLGASFRVIRHHQQRIRDTFSNLDKVKLSWLRNLLIIFGVIWVAALLRFLSAYGEVGYENKIAVPILLCLTIFVIAGYALRQPEIFSNRWDNVIDQSVKIPGNVVSIGIKRKEEPIKPTQSKYEYSNLDQQNIQSYKEDLSNYLEQEKPYINPNLKLGELADHLGMPSYQLSQVINIGYQQNFYDLINSLRIAEAKRILASPSTQHNKMIGIAFDVGFNSKSTFNAAFKKHAGMTPTQFKNSYMTNLNSGGK
ncbi:MAG: AraC family transcriptional regulator [Gammaproteobacteria bacterium]|nr:AraC family transcriptional regulator [Gammaproteobacteria bacterium]